MTLAHAHHATDKFSPPQASGSRAQLSLVERFGSQGLFCEACTTSLVLQALFKWIRRMDVHAGTRLGGTRRADRR